MRRLDTQEKSPPNSCCCQDISLPLVTAQVGRTLKGVLHALCNAHDLRELQALVEIEKEVWARKMRCLLRRACHAVNLAREQDASLSPRLIALIERCYDTIVTAGFAFHEAQPALAYAADIGKPRGRKPRRVGHNLLLRLDGRKQDVLRFLSDSKVPFTNSVCNPFERNVRSIST